MKKLLVYILFLFCNFAFAQPDPYPANPQIQSIVNQINSDSIFSYINQLAAFHTRHTYSDTTSDSVGIGAAIRWMEGKVRAYQADTLVQTEQWPWVRNWEGQNRTRHLLVARKNGSLRDSSRYLIGGHIDSRTVNGSDESGFAPGADDNASSCAIILEMVRLLPDTILHNAEFIWFTGEEQGLWGSAAYANHFVGQGRRIDGMIAMDMNSHISLANGAVDSVSLRLYAQGDFNQGGSASVSRILQRYMKWVGESYVPDFSMQINAATDRPGRGSDHISFSEAGYPAVRVIERNEDLNHQHNPNDLPQFVTPSYARKNGIVTYGALLTMLKAPARTPAPILTWIGNNQIQITVPDSVILPEGGSFFVAIRNFTNNYYDQIAEIDTARSYVFQNAEIFQSYCFALSRSNGEGFPSPFSSEAIFDVTSVEDPSNTLPQTFSFTTFPNPFNNEIALRYNLTQTSRVKLRIYNQLGREAALLADDVKPAGVWQIAWKPLGVSSGLYFVRLETEFGTAVKKIQYLK